MNCGKTKKRIPLKESVFAFRNQLENLKTDISNNYIMTADTITHVSF